MNWMIARKKLLLAFLFLALPLFLLVMSIVLVYNSQRELTQKAIYTVNKEFLGELVVEDSYISPFANFPYISIDLRGVKFYPDKTRTGDPIYFIGDLYIGFNLWDILKGDYKVKKIKLKNGHLNLVKYANGDINLLLAKGLEDEEPEEEGEPLEFDLKGLVVDKFEVRYLQEDSGDEFVFHLDKLNTILRYEEEQIFLDLFSNFGFDWDKNGAHTFFSEKKMQLDLHLDYFPESQRLKISPSKMLLEEALFAISGEVTNLEEGLDLDLKLQGEKPDFNLLAAFLPKEIAQAFKRYTNEGEVFFTGSIKGMAGKNQSPAIAFEFGCDNAFFLNPGINKKVDDLRFSGFFTNGEERNLRTSELRFQNFLAKPDQGDFEANLLIKNFEDPYIKVNLNADLDLGFLGDFFEIDGLQGLSGQVVLRMDFDELVDLDMGSNSISTIKESIESELYLKNLSFTVPDFGHEISQVNAYAFMDKGQFRLEHLNFRIKDSDFHFSGELSDLPALFHKKEKPVVAKLIAKSKKINLAQLFPNTKSDSLKEEVSDFSMQLGLETSAQELINFRYLPKGNFFIDDFYAKLSTYPHTFHDFHADIFIGEQEIRIKDFKGWIDDTDFLVTGAIKNYPKWFQEEVQGQSIFELDFASKRFVPNDLLTLRGVNYLPVSYREEVFSNVKLQAKLDLNYNGAFQSADLYLKHLEGRMKFHPLKLENFQGKLHLDKEHFKLENFGGKMGSSDFKLDMGYFFGDSKPANKRNYLYLKAKALDLDALMGYQGVNVDTNHQEAFNIFDLPFKDMEFKAEVGKMYYHTVWLEKIKFRARSTAQKMLYLDTLGVEAADGKVTVKGYFNGTDPKNIYFHTDIQAQKMDLDKLLFKFTNMGQDFVINENLKGKVSGRITGKFLVYPDFTPIVDKSEAKMQLTVYQGSLVNFAPMRALSSYFSDRNLSRVRFDTLSNTFELKSGVLHIPKMNINSSLGFIELSGRQSLDMEMDYFLRIPWSLVTQVGVRALFGGKNKEEVDPDQEDAIIFRDQDRRVRFVNIHMSGSPDNYRVALRRDRKAAGP